MTVEVSTVWKHIRSGGHFIVLHLGVSIIDDNQRDIVVYERVSDHTVYVVSLEEFVDGRFVPDPYMSI